MTKKDFELIAGTLKDIRDLQQKPAYIELIDNVSECIANALPSCNPLFNREKFLTACGVTEKHECEYCRANGNYLCSAHDGSKYE